ncbi:MAG: UvrD-helicase domain-containing protein [Burkholderiales bacterium]|nr:UvrD-helicase domain-containing protein [Burkholderiales bacterium]MCE7876284.1 DNA helicase II [Betaproteobacteria bacterium PRO3]
MPSPLLADLNPRQHEAVTLPHASALVLAGAGSGKTRVLTTRIAWLIATGQASPLSILAVTFTNKAAREMLLRLSALTPVSVRGMWIGTFHGLCNRMLRAHHRDADLPQLFQIMDTADQLALIKRLYKAHGLDDERYPPRELAWFIASAKEAGLRPQAVEAGDAFARARVEHYALYEAMCRREGVVDFAELLLRSYELLAGHDAIREHYQRRFSNLLVDEFQDTNALQYRWLRLLAGPEAAVFAVGDDDQSIYAFRGANAANMQHFERDFGRPDRPVRLVKLEQNYRSHGNILDAANALIRHNRSRLGKELWTSEGKGEPIRAFAAPTDLDEAAFVVDAVKGIADEGVPLSEIALLYRSNAQSRVLEHALFNAGLPYRVWGGMRFFERAEVKHALGYLRLVASPEDDGAFLRVVNFPPRGIGARTLEQLQDEARGRGTSLWQAAASGAVGGRAGTSLAAFVRLIEKLRAETAALPLFEAVAQVNEASGLVAHYRAEKDGEDRIGNLEELVNAAQGFVREAEIASDAPMIGERVDADAPVPSDGPSEGATDPLTAFLAHAALEAGETQEAEGRPALQLMTVHSAKGLEFHTVFVTGLEEGLFPHENSLNEMDGPEEERRLMYVALTRARRRLYLTHAQSRMLHGQTRWHVASRFLDELPRELVAWLSPARTRYGAIDVDEAEWGKPRHVPVPETNAPGWRIGQNVRHAKFGVGVIVGAEGRGSDARVQVNFREVGVKWLALEYAKLEAA